MDRFITKSVITECNRVFASELNHTIINQLINELSNSEILCKSKIAVPKRIIIHGPHHTGKSHIADYLASKIFDGKILKIDCKAVNDLAELRCDFFRDQLYDDIRAQLQYAYSNGFMIHIIYPSLLYSTSTMTQSKSMELIDTCMTHYDGKCAMIIEDLDASNLNYSVLNASHAVLTTDYPVDEIASLMKFVLGSYVADSVDYDAMIPYLIDNHFTHANIVNLCNQAHINACMDKRILINPRDLDLAIARESNRVKILQSHKPTLGNPALYNESPVQSMMLCLGGLYEED